MPFFSIVQAAGTICAACQLQINQQLTFERQGFNATMTITNGLAGTALTNISVAIYFTDANGKAISSTTNANATGSIFFNEPATGQGTPLFHCGRPNHNSGLADHSIPWGEQQ